MVPPVYIMSMDGVLILWFMPTKIRKGERRAVRKKRFSDGSPEPHPIFVKQRYGKAGGEPQENPFFCRLGRAVFCFLATGMENPVGFRPGKAGKPRRAFPGCGLPSCRPAPGARAKTFAASESSVALIRKTVAVTAFRVSVGRLRPVVKLYQKKPGPAYFVAVV